MSQTHSPYAPSPPQEYSGYQYRNVLPQPPSPRYNQQTSSPLQTPSHYYDTQHQPSPAYNTPTYQYSPQQIPQNSSPLPNTPLTRSPMTAPAQRSPMVVTGSPQGQFPPTSAYHAITQGVRPPMSVPPMQQNSMFNQSPYQSSRRPLPTPSGMNNSPNPSGVARPYTQPPLSRRPLPQPHPSPSAPNTPFRHRPSYSVAENNSGSGFSTRPLPTPVSRSTKSLDLTRSVSPFREGYAAPSQFQPNVHHNLPDLPEKIDGLPATTSHINRTPTVTRPLPLPHNYPTPPSISPPALPEQASGITRTASTEEASKPRTASPFRSRSRTLPHALPPPTSALPRRPDSVLAPNYLPAPAYVASSQFRGSPVSSESEDMYDNPLLRHPQQQHASPIAFPERTPSPSPETRSRFIERSPERGPPQSQVNGAANIPAQPQTRGNTVTGAPPTRARRLSLVSRMAEMSMIEAAATLNEVRKELPNAPNNSNLPQSSHVMAPLSRSTTQQSQPRWPSDLPPLPRAPHSQSEPGERQGNSRQVSPTRAQPPQHPIRQQASPTRTHFPPIQRNNERPQQFPPPPTHPESPTRREFRPTGSSRDPSPSRSQIQANPPALPPRNSNPASPTRSRFSRQAPVREPILPAPRAQRMIPNLEDAPPPSLRRSPSPSPTRSSIASNELYTNNRRSYHQAMPSLPNIQTQGMHSPTKMASPAKVVSPPAVTPQSADSAFSLSAFPAPPQVQQGYSSSGFHSGPGSRMHSRNVSFPASADDDDDLGYASGPSITISGPNTPQTNPNSSPGGVPQIAIQMDDDDNTMQMPVISVGGPEETGADPAVIRKIRQRDLGPLPRERSKGGLCCGGCGNPVIGRAVHTTDASWHPGCLKCTACGQLLVDFAVCEYEGRPYCSLDYYENFAPRCHHCQTAIADPNYVTLKDEQLGERTYHEQHFFCAECGDPFLPPSSTPRSFSGDGQFEADDGIKFIVHNCHAYCENCHVRLRMPKCKKCKKSLRTDDDQLEFLGQKYCPDCFVCKGCEGPFVNGQLFVRDDKPFCRRCYDIIIKSEL